MLSLGATTFWEDFNIDWMENASRIDEPVPEGKRDIHGDFGGYCYLGFRHSFCHGWASGPVPFLMHTVLGVNVTAPGTEKLEIRPDLGGLSYVRGVYPTPHGDIGICHTKEVSGEIKTEITLPQGWVQTAPGMLEYRGI